jgi:hypothetical protein
MTAILGVTPRMLLKCHRLVMENNYYGDAGLDRELGWLKKHLRTATP